MLALPLLLLYQLLYQQNFFCQLLLMLLPLPHVRLTQNLFYHC